MYRKNISEYFDNISEVYEIETMEKKDYLSRYNLWERNIDKYSIEFCDNLIYDLGCGNGILSVYCVSKGYKTISIDSSSKMIRLLSDKIGNDTGNICIHNKMLPMEEDYISSKSNTASIILLSSVFEYVSEKEKLTEQCYNLLRPGGYLFISIPNKVSFFRKIEIIFKKLGLFSKNNFHFIINYMNEKQIKQLFLKYGFTIQEMAYYGKYDFGKRTALNKYFSSLIFLVLKK
jgi:2-polyprenyl-3-methyl-5-hydroxy-6-metoxy-1,4-benzoquinol methylase